MKCSKCSVCKGKTNLLRQIFGKWCCQICFSNLSKNSNFFGVGVDNKHFLEYKCKVCGSKKDLKKVNGPKKHKKIYLCWLCRNNKVACQECKKVFKRSYEYGMICEYQGDHWYCWDCFPSWQLKTCQITFEEIEIEDGIL